MAVVLYNNLHLVKDSAKLQITLVSSHSVDEFVVLLLVLITFRILFASHKNLLINESETYKVLYIISFEINVCTGIQNVPCMYIVEDFCLVSKLLM